MGGFLGSTARRWLAAGCLLGSAATAQQGTLAPGFVDEFVFGHLPQVSGFCFGPTGEIWLWQKEGLVWVVRDGLLASQPVLDLREEVGNWGDNGMFGFALDPSFGETGWIYAMYVVDRHHAESFGTPDYDPAFDVSYKETIGRITRYRVDDPFATEPLALAGSRRVLVGETLGTGIPVCASVHGLGSLVFGADGSLLASCGDSAGETPTGTCLADGIIRPAEDVSNYRAQLVDGHNGRVLRLDPRTGDGVPTNPFYDAASPRSGASRTWVLGLRNPFRFTVRPGTGGGSGPFGHPGALYIGDVGEQNMEELDVAFDAGLNFGWPIWEGHGLEPSLSALVLENLDAPNPLNGQTSHGATCSIPFFTFHDLIVPDAIGPGAWSNPCAPTIPIPAGVPKFKHMRPRLAWGHADSYLEPVTFVPGHDADGNPVATTLGASGSGTTGSPFFGNCSLGGAWYEGSAYPEQYHGAYFHLDYGERWIATMRFDGKHAVESVEPFGTDMGQVLALATHPIEGDLYYLDYTGDQGSSIRRITYGGNALPVAVAQASPSTGIEPLRVELDASGSWDPEGGPLTHRWSYGDRTAPSPVDEWERVLHVYPSEDVTPFGRVLTYVAELGGSSHAIVGASDPEVMADGVWADGPIPDGEPYQYDTLHFDPFGTSSKNGVDWLGYGFPSPRTFVGAVFQEGQPHLPDGGWFDTIGVEVRDPATGVWAPVTGLVENVAQPPTPEVPFETVQLFFDPVEGDGIRVVGKPGGTFEYVSVGELRVFAAPPAQGVPASWTPQLRVTDDVGNVGGGSTTVSINSTPPQVTVTSPQEDFTYPVGQVVDVPLTADIVDASQSVGPLDCRWDVTLVHDNHEHPEPALHACGGSFPILPHGELGGDVMFWTVDLTVTNVWGLSTTVSRVLLPEGDCNLNGQDDALDVASGFAEDCNGNGVPDSCDIALGTSADIDGNGVPDECDPLSVDVDSISLLAGGTQHMALDAGPAHASELYFVLGSSGGQEPGFVFDDTLVPLNPLDNYFTLALTYPNVAPLLTTIGFLDGEGRAGAAFSFPFGSNSQFSGLVLHHAFVTFDSLVGSVNFASNAVPLHLVD